MLLLDTKYNKAGTLTILILVAKQVSAVEQLGCLILFHCLISQLRPPFAYRRLCKKGGQG